MNNFNDCLSKANDEKLDPFWIAIYEEMFPNIAHISSTIGNKKLQHKGVDRIITLENNRTIYIDEKLRFTVYPDILLEDISVLYPNGKEGATGWMNKDIDIDYLAYAFKPNKTCYIFPWFPLKRAWKYYRKRWIDKYGYVYAPNPGYETANVPVPISILKEKIADATKITLPDENPPKNISNQL